MSTNTVSFHVTTNLNGSALNEHLNNLGKYLDRKYINSVTLQIDRTSGEYYLMFLFGPNNVSMRAKFKNVGMQVNKRRLLVVIEPGKGREGMNLKRYCRNEFDTAPTDLFREIFGKAFEQEREGKSELEGVVEPAHL